MFKNIIQQIFYEKVSSIQSKVPVKLNMPNTSSLSFSNVLSDSINSEKNIQNANNRYHPDSFDYIIDRAASKYNVPKSLIKSVIAAESNFNPNAISSAGAKGLMQLMPLTAEYLGVKNIWDVEQNINGGTKYLKELLDRYDNKIPLALAAYNAGPGNVEKYGGIPPFRETQNYINKVLKNMEKFS